MPFHALEPRLLFAADFVLLSHGILYATAGQSPIHMTVGYADAAKSKIVVTSGGTRVGPLFDSFAVRRVVLTGGAFYDHLEASHTLARFDKPMLIDGKSGVDTLAGGDGDDALIGNAGDDELAGGRGDDLLLGGVGGGVLDGGPGDDQIYGGTVNPSRMYGGPGDDRIFGPAGLAIGGAGHDQIYVGPGGRAFGGSGDDVFFSAGDVSESIIGGSGEDRTVVISRRKAANRIDRLIADSTPAYHLTEQALSFL